MRDVLLFFTVIGFIALGYPVLCLFEKWLFSNYKVKRTSFPSFENEVFIIPAEDTPEAKMEAFAGFIGRHESCAVVLLDGGSEAPPAIDEQLQRKLLRCKGA